MGIISFFQLFYRSGFFFNKLGEKIKPFSFKSGIKQRCLLLPFLFIILKIVASAIGQAKEMKIVRIKKEGKLF